MALATQFSAPHAQDDGLPNIIRDFSGLAIAAQSLANFFYDENGRPHMDRSYRPGIKPLNALEWKDISDQSPNPFTFFERINGLGDWLRAHDVDQIAHYASGRSAHVSALKLKSGEIKILRYALDECSEQSCLNYTSPTNDFLSLHTRLTSPLVLQPHASVNDLMCSKRALDLPGHVRRFYSTRFEILPMLPVFPNDIAGIESVPGHDMYFPDPLSQEIISPDSWQRLEGQKLTFCSYLISQGFKLSRVADIGVLPDGTPIFVDPDTLKEGNHRVHVASARAQNLIGQVLPAEIATQFKWVTDDCAWSDRVPTSTKQDHFFPNPYKKSERHSPELSAAR